MRVVFLLGSGASLHAEMPCVERITARVLSGEAVRESGSRFLLVEHPHQELWCIHVKEAVAFAAKVKHLCDDYWTLHDKARETNYEDIAYVARQIADGRSEYENPALLPLYQKLGSETGCEPHQLRTLAGKTADYIEDVVCGMLGGPIGPVDHLKAIVDACNDDSIDETTLATLNHDLVLEQMLSQSCTPYSDGFAREHGPLRIWDNTFESNCRLLKLHGSVNWWRYDLTLDSFNGQFTGQSTNGDAEKPQGHVGEELGTRSTRPLILTGTFNKILAYPSGIYADQHFRFHEALNTADALIVIGYGFRDKAINARIVAWAERPGARRMVVVHRTPGAFATSARGAIRNLWQSWCNRGLLTLVPEHLTPNTSWSSIRNMVAPLE